MADLQNTRTWANLELAFASRSQANRRYLYFAQKADADGYPDTAALFRSIAEGETRGAFGHFDFLKSPGDPVTAATVGSTVDNLRSAIATETYESIKMYPGFAEIAREEGFDEIAEWLETLTRAARSHAARFTEDADTHRAASPEQHTSGSRATKPKSNQPQNEKDSETVEGPTCLTPRTQ